MSSQMAWLARRSFAKSHPPAVNLDLRSPGSSGCDLGKKIAKLTPGLPLGVHSASADVADKVLLLEMGADDYVTVPFQPHGIACALVGAGVLGWVNLRRG